MRIKRSLQRGPKYPKERKTPRPKAKRRRTPNAAEQQNRAATTVATTARPWWQPRSDRGEPHGRGGVLFTRSSGFPSRASLTSDGSASVLPLYCDVSGHSEKTRHSHFAFYLHHSFRVVFRERKKERRKTARILHRA